MDEDAQSKKYPVFGKSVRRGKELADIKVVEAAGSVFKRAIGYRTCVRVSTTQVD